MTFRKAALKAFFDSGLVIAIVLLVVKGVGAVGILPGDSNDEVDISLEAEHQFMPNERLPFYAEASFTPHWFGSDADVPQDFHHIGSFNLTNQEGQAVTEETFENKIYIANFFFASCSGICPMTMANLQRLEQSISVMNDVLILSHSVTPDKDSVPALKSFGSMMNARAEKWHLTTGDRDHIYNLGKNYYFAEEDLGEASSESEFLHTESFFLIDQRRRIRGVYNGMNKTAVNQLLEDVQTLRNGR